MDLNGHGNRLMLLECLKENAANMRIEHQQLRERITSALDRARASLMSIENLNVQLNDIKTTVDNVLSSLNEDPVAANEELQAVEDVREILLDTDIDENVEETVVADDEETVEE